MKLKLSECDVHMLKDNSIEFDPKVEVSEDQAFELLDLIYEEEIEYANSEEESDLRFAIMFASIADKLQAQLDKV